MSILPIGFAAELLLIYSALHHRCQGGAHTFLLTFPARRASDDPLWKANVDFDEGVWRALGEMWVGYLIIGVGMVLTKTWLCVQIS